MNAKKRKLNINTHPHNQNAGNCWLEKAPIIINLHQCNITTVTTLSKLNRETQQNQFKI